MALQVSVIIPHYNDLDGLKLCVRLLERQTVPRDSYEIVVADNNSRCGIDAVIAAVPSARVVPAPIQGAGPARNAAVAAAQGDILAFTDSDCRPHADWIEHGVAALSQYDFVGGQVATVVEVPGQPSSVEAFDLVFAFNNRRYVEDLGFSVTANLIARREVFDRAGGFRVTVSEDVEWCHRASSTGFRLGYADDVVIEHPARRNWAELRKRWERVQSEMFAMQREQKLGRLRFLAKALAMPFSIAPHAVKILRSHRLGSLSAKLSALGVLIWLRLWRTGLMLRLLSGSL